MPPNTAEGKILQTAQNLFIEGGFAGTSLSQIATTAGVAKGLVLHYFHTKQKLWQAVENNILQQNASPVNFTYEDCHNARAFLTKALTQRFRLYNENPNMARLANWQRLEGAKKQGLGTSPTAPDYWHPLILRLQKDNQIRPDLDTNLIILLMLSSLSGAFMENRAFFKNDPLARERYLSLVIDAIYQVVKC